MKDPLGNRPHFLTIAMDLTAQRTTNNTTTFSWYAYVPICLTGITDAIGNLTSLRPIHWKA